ncbi:hypothetical protein NX722_07355 [Endozoicomonas gorgoniicola]|uniref:Uncharacterized protein n=1 Tax=Endozoicomonas gorgoniicola TaxID=1234144 RepID=A0ABT3MTQ3_9GAMM|nr:hypothetical protein [Endozoicomonas gorgoniicola]MCW7552463.1 hypothetical protein [Endozoicomonas gorgoniicola]
MIKKASGAVHLLPKGNSVEHLLPMKLTQDDLKGNRGRWGSQLLKFALLSGHSEREASRDIYELVSPSRCRVLATQGDKGVFSEDHPLYPGSIGVGSRPEETQSLSDNTI